LTLDPDRADVHEAVATAYFIMKQYGLAIEHFTRVTQLRPTEAKALINLGAVYNRQGEFQKAADILKKAMAKDGKAVEAYYNLGIAYRGLNQLQLAANTYKEALRINPRMLDAMQNLANLLLEMNNPRAAIEQYKKALEINPDFDRAKLGLARAEEAQKQTKANINPFGRLVSETALNAAPTEIRARRLDPVERKNDRQILRRLMIEMQATNQQLLEHLRDHLEGELTQLNRGVQTSNEKVSKLLFSSNDSFQDVLKRFQELRAELRRLTKELKAHESQMTLP
jgi:tetratricopeptide (TPR) repeat protein